MSSSSSTRAAPLLAENAGVNLDGAGDGLADGAARIERGIGVLEHDLVHLAEAPQTAPPRSCRTSSAVEDDLASRRLDQPDHQDARAWTCRCRFRRPGRAPRPRPMVNDTPSTARSVGGARAQPGQSDPAARPARCRHRPGTDRSWSGLRRAAEAAPASANRRATLAAGFGAGPGRAASAGPSSSAGGGHRPRRSAWPAAPAFAPRQRGSAAAKTQPGTGTVRSGNCARESAPALAARSVPRGAAAKPAGPWCKDARARQGRRLAADLDHPAGIDDAHAIGDPVHHAEIVGDEEHADLARAADVVEQIEDVRFDRDIERGGRLIEDRAARDRRPARSRSATRCCMPPRQLMRDRR